MPSIGEKPYAPRRSRRFCSRLWCFMSVGDKIVLLKLGSLMVLHAFKRTDAFTPLGGLLLNKSTNTLYGMTTGVGDIAHCSLAVTT